ncbi:tRNA (adenosine(37)-N6)-threonylcarbamoyltransferase complex ATPase subunit type 1 TsaE [Parapedobacter koreensis]|uniref:tRNA threonylcarbamoyladenosine biosynthesis protein TsaE n=1 Tax=Parapedobacter koreensis TaxID=332977 RepID=A0A1H7QSY8_9SPHI|nr:tRNA (adenosine(37)-N6)-threonylcarbamoyltransferase complex ATPase subunit type 1 TsaE [Parapedobacter koreensis]SEL51053.1 tRNA threonylcarbamoyladenosine biosynthesis protein TsaE [Parapedobacter koreensis]
MVVEVANLADLPNAAAQVVAAGGGHRVFLFYGEMGAGKTTLIKAICDQLGVTDQTSSPTFAIVNEYNTTEEPIYHFDFYRIKAEQEAFDLGYEDYFYSGSYCFVEWPEKIAGLLPDDAIEVTIAVTGNDSRHITVQPRQ